MSSNYNRLTFIDFARTYAVFIALLSHALVTAGVFDQLEEGGLYIRQFTRMATPMFIFMFGFMIEFVYVRKARELGIKSIRHRLFVRGFQCYIAYSLISLCSVIGGYRTVEEFISSLLFFGNSRFGNILRVYSILLLCMPFLIKLRLKYGEKSIFIALLVIIISFTVTIGTKSYSFGVFDHPLNVVFGIGPKLGGPSVWHSMSFVLAGMYMASSLRERPHDQLSNFYISSIVLIITSLILGAALVDEKFFDAWQYFYDSTYRNSNMAGYYIIGIICSVISITMICFIIGDRALPRPIRHLLPIGYASLFAYTLGNVLLNIFGSFAKQFHPLLFVLLFFSCVFFITIIRTRLPFYNALSDILNLGYDNSVKGRH